MASINDRQIENRSFLSPTGFKFVLSKAPKVAFFSNYAMIPGITRQPEQEVVELENGGRRHMKPLTCRVGKFMKPRVSQLTGPAGLTGIKHIR